MVQYSSSERVRNDRLRTVTRGVALLLIPFLLVACVILIFFSDETGRRFAWDIQPPLTAVIMGAGYLGGAYFFLRAASGHTWHHYRAGYLPVTLYTVLMLLATLIHLDRFNPGHFPFQVWFALYIITPFLIAWVWWRNERLTIDDGDEQPAAALLVPASLRWGIGAIGGLVLLLALLAFIRPEPAIAIWPWSLSPLTARVLAGWHAFLGAGGLVLARERPWSNWRIPLQSIMLWQGLALLGLIIHRAVLTRLLNPYLLYVGGGLLLALLVYLAMETRARHHQHTIGSVNG